MTRTYFQGNLYDRMDYYTDRSGEHWLWTGTQDGKGYGLVWDGSHNQYAHVVAWEREHGESAAGRVVRHDCDTPLCVRPRCLLIGTHADNVADKVKRGRQCRGGEHGLSKLTEEDVRAIRHAWESRGISQYRLAKQYGLNQSNVSMIVNRKTWTHI